MLFVLDGSVRLEGFLRWTKCWDGSKVGFKEMQVKEDCFMVGGELGAGRPGGWLEVGDVVGVPEGDIDSGRCGFVEGVGEAKAGWGAIVEATS